MLPWVELSPKFCAMPPEPAAITIPPVIATGLKVLEMEVGKQKMDRQGSGADREAKRAC